MTTNIHRFNKLCEQLAGYSIEYKNCQKTDYESSTFSINLFTPTLLSQFVADEISRFVILKTGNSPSIDFANTLSSYTLDALARYSNPKDLIKRKKQEMELGSSMDERQRSEIAGIINGFLNAESKKALQRIENSAYREVFISDSTISPEYDYSKVCPLDTFENYRSVLFHEENNVIVMNYYLEYISMFPISLDEFEKILFYFITLLTDKKYPVGIEILENLKFIDHVNEILRMRFIDMNDEVIMVILNAISTVPVLKEACKLLNECIKRNKDLLRQQFEGMAS